MFRFRSQILARRSVIGISQVSFGGSKAVAVNLVISKSQIFSGIAKRTFFFIFFPVFGMLDIAVLKNEFLCSQGAAGSTVDKHYLTMVW